MVVMVARGGVAILARDLLVEDFIDELGVHIFARDTE